MVIFEIRDNMNLDKRLLGYLFYYERSRRFFAELLEGVDEWEAPFIFSSFVKKNIRSIDSEWSMKFVQQRIIPADRQNLGDILKANNLSVYDEYKLLQLSEGRCAQDELFLVKISAEKLLPEIVSRLKRKVRDVLPMTGLRATVFYMNDTARIIDLKELCGSDRRFDHIFRNEDLYHNIRVSPGGNGIEWGEERFLPAERLYTSGIESPLCYSDVLAFVKKRVIDTTETAELLNCSRQYINQLTKNEKISPLKNGSNNNLFLKADLEKE